MNTNLKSYLSKDTQQVTFSYIRLLPHHCDREDSDILTHNFMGCSSDDKKRQGICGDSFISLLFLRFLKFELHVFVVCECICEHYCVYAWRGCQILQSLATGTCEPPKKHVGNQTWNLCYKSTCSLLMSYRSRH